MKVKLLHPKEITTLGVGREREILLPENLKELSYLVKEGLTPIGGGSNSVLKESSPLISLKNFKKVEVKEGEITLGAGVELKEVIKLQVKKGFSLFEFLAGVPKATVGGLVAQNAGAFGREVKDLLKEITYLDREGEVRKLKEFDRFGYRSSPFPKEGVVVEAKFKIAPKRGVKREVEKFVKARLSKQPSFFLRTAGSTFKNLKEAPAGKLLDQCGLKGFFIKELGFSEKHANFLINRGNGSLEEFEEIVEIAKEKVKESFGLELSLEIKLI
ncbi:UDP-N-acetylmuramate dehydrogenase [Thermovibrio sp.]